MPSKKTLFIFDIDSTLTKFDSCLFTYKYTLGEEAYNKAVELAKVENWVESFNRLYELLKEKNKNFNDVKEAIEHIEINEGFIELLNYLHSNKEKFDVIAISSGYYNQIEYLLKFNNIFDKFDAILCIKSELLSNGLVKAFYKEKEHNCKLCNACQCKTVEYNEYLKNKENCYEKTIFICDGLSDFCLAKNLNENDVVMPRKNFSFYNKYKLQDEKLKCKVESWENGNDIINFIKK